MSSRDLVYSPSRAAVAASRSEKSVGGAAGVEIVGFPQVLHTRTAGDPDMLFVSLLDGAREAREMIERLAGRGEERANAVMLSAMQLATSLLRDSSFALAAKGMSHENLYTVDLDAGTMLVNTRLYAVVSRRTSFFKVEIAGKIAGGPFVVRNPVQGSVIMQVEEERLRQVNFFSTLLAQECLRAQMEEERFGRLDATLGTDAKGEARLAVTVAGNKIPVALRQKEEGGSWEIVDGRGQESVGTLTPELEEHLKKLIHGLGALLEGK